MREPRYSILADIQDAIEQAKQGKLALFWQRTIQREYSGKKVTPDEQQAYEQLQSILSEVPQWSDEEELHHDIENIGGKLWFCHFWIDHNSMVQLTEDRNGRFHVAYVLDRNTSPEIRREAAQLAQKDLKKCMQKWGAALLDAVVLAVVSKEKEGTYGYKITQDVRKAIEVSESTLYPVLRRLQKDGYLIVYDRECGGRNRRYYQITETGEEKLAEYRSEWESYSSKISELFSGEESEE